MANSMKQKMLLLGTLMFLPLAGLWANNSNFTWGSQSGQLGTGGHSSDFIASAGAQGSFDAFGGGSVKFLPGDTLTIDAIATVSGEVVLDAAFNAVDLAINIGGPLMIQTSPEDTAMDRGYVTVRPANADASVAPVAGSVWGHLVFNTAAEHVTSVNFPLVSGTGPYSLVFTGSHNPNASQVDLPLYISFWGQGQVNFKVKDGVLVAFRNEYDDGTTHHRLNPGGLQKLDCGWAPLDYQDNGAYAAGVRVFVIMDQTGVQAENGESKLVFSRNQFAPDNTNPLEGEPAEVWIGAFSWITYLSTLSSGFGGEETTGYGSIAFDPSAQGTSRLTLRLLQGEFNDPSVTDPVRGSYFVDEDTFTDGALVVCGHRMYARTGGFSDARTDFQLNHMAGVQATAQIIDEVAFAANNNYYNTPNSRRGLLLVNDNKTVPFFASNPYSEDREDPTDTGFEGNSFFRFGFTPPVSTTPGSSTVYTGQIRNGCVVGVNGQLSVFHNTFLDYVATSTPRAIPDTIQGLPMPTPLASIYPFFESGSELIPLFETKKHNPSALIIDGLTTGLQSNGTPFSDPFNSPGGNGNAVAFSAFVDDGMHALISLYGDARIYLRSAVGIDQNGDPFVDEFPYTDMNGDCVYSFTIGQGPYTLSVDPRTGLNTDPLCPGFSVQALIPCVGDNDDDDNIRSRVALDACISPFIDTGIFGEGFHVLDVEGRLTVASFDDTANHSLRLSRHTGTGTTRAGKINVPSLRLDNAGNEVDADGNIVVRPLALNSVEYPRYQSSTLFFNAPVDYPFFGVPSADFYDTTFVQNDVAKAFAIPDPMLGEPIITGGSRAAFDDFNGLNVFQSELPIIRLINSTIELHESMISTGVRFEIPENNIDANGNTLFGSAANNTSTIVAFNHGDIYGARTGRGRTFMLGTQQNLLAAKVVLAGPGGTMPMVASTVAGVYASPTGASFNAFYNQPFPLENAFVNVYRRTVNASNPAPTIDLAFDVSVDPGAAGLPIFGRTAEHLFFMGNDSQMTIGWFDTVGDSLLHPWWNLFDSNFPDNSDPANPGNIANQFVINGFDQNQNAVKAAQVTIAGNYWWFGGFDTNGPAAFDNSGKLQPTGNKVITPVVTPFDPRAVFVNNGGVLNTLPGISSTFDTTIARLIGQSDSTSNLGSDDDLNNDVSGQVDIPLDQIKFTFQHSMQPYSLNLSNGNVHLNVFNPNHPTSPFIGNPIDQSSGEMVTVSWLYRTDSTNFAPIKEFDKATKGLKGAKKAAKKGGVAQPAKNIKDQLLESVGVKANKSGTTRFVPDLPSPVIMPQDLLFVTAGDYIRQLRVSGATIADPFHLYITGDGNGYGQITEFATQYIDITCGLVRPVYGDGDYAALFLDQGGRIGLGKKDWNEHTDSAWSRLGWDYVSVVANGNGTVDVNSDLIIADKLPIIPTTNFGSETTQRLEFYSPDNRVILVPFGHELDLSAFGRGSTSALQQIAFSGNVKLVFEPGSILRFPDANVVNGETGNGTGVILYMNDSAQLVFSDNRNQDQNFFTTPAGTAQYRTRIMGKGQIWLNKNASLQVNGNPFVGIETDAKTLHTDIIISIQGQGQMQIGTNTLTGGAFQVGNQTDQEGAFINFMLRMNGADPVFTLERGGFFGLAVGVIDNASSNPNGNAVAANNPTRDANGDAIITGGFPSFTPGSTAWVVQSLFNVRNVEIRNISGTFDHSNIFDGSDSLASVMGVGTVNGNYIMNVGGTFDAIFKGGGNVLFIRDNTGLAPNGFTQVNIWDWAEAIGDANPAFPNDNGKYSILSSEDVFRQLITVPGQAGGTIINNPTATGTPVVIEGTAIGDGRFFQGKLDDFYKYMTFPNYPTMGPAKFVDFGTTQFINVAGFVNNGLVTTAAPNGNLYLNATNLQRFQDPIVIATDGFVADATTGLARGVLGGAGQNSQNLNPEQFVAIKNQ